MPSAFIIAATRTPFGRLGGALAHIRTDDLAAIPIHALLARQTQFDGGAVEEVILGCANQAGEDNRNVARMAALLAGLPASVPGVTVNRLCASGLEAIGQAARAIACGAADLVIAGGVESMTRAPYVLPKADHAYSRRQTLEDSALGWHLINPLMRMRYGVDSMIQTAENLAQERKITRSDQDAYALRSQTRTARAQRAGWLAEEITSVPARDRDTEVSVDEHPRPDATLQALATLNPVLGPGTTVTAGNASGINDGAAAVLLASEQGMRRHGLTPLARVVGMAAAGVEPRIMGIGPVRAIVKLLARIRWKLSECERIEINEAFAAQVLACTRELGLADDDERVNANGGAIALGHPLGASGARLAITSAFALRRHHQRRALVSLCVGVGQGLALALESP